MRSPPELIMQGPAEKVPAEAGALMGHLKQALKCVFLESAHVSGANAKPAAEAALERAVPTVEGFLKLANAGSASNGDTHATQLGGETRALNGNRDAASAAPLAIGILGGTTTLPGKLSAVANLCSILEQILQHGLRPSVSEGGYGLIGGVMGGWRRAPSQQPPPGAWRFLEAVVAAQPAGGALAQPREVTSATEKSTEAANPSANEGTEDAVSSGKNGDLTASSSSGGECAGVREGSHSYPPLASGLAQIRAVAGTSTDSVRLQALLRLGLSCRCLGPWLAEALLSPTAQGASGKGGLLAQLYDEIAFVRSHDNVEALVATMMALGPLRFDGLETGFKEGSGLVRESGHATTEGPADAPGGATGAGVSEGLGSGAKLSESGQSAGKAAVSASGGVLNTGWSTLTSVGTGAASLVLEGGSAASGLWKTVNSTSQNWGTFAASRVLPKPAPALSTGPKTASPIGVHNSITEGGQLGKEGTSSQAPQTDGAGVRENEELTAPLEENSNESNGSEPAGSILIPGQDMNLQTEVSRKSTGGEKQPDLSQPGSFLPTVANKAATAVTAAASTISEGSLKPMFSYPFRRPSSSGGAEATGRPPVALPPTEAMTTPGAGMISERLSSANEAMPANCADDLETVKPSNYAETATRLGFFFPFQRPSSSDGVGDRGTSQPASKPFWRRFSSGSEPTSSGFDELFPEAEFGSNENGEVLQAGVADGREKDGLDWLRAEEHVGGFDPGGGSLTGGGKQREEVQREILAEGHGANRSAFQGLRGRGAAPAEQKGAEELTGSHSAASGSRSGAFEKSGMGTGSQKGASETRGGASESQKGFFNDWAGQGVVVGREQNEEGRVPTQLTAQTPARPWSESWAPGSLFSAAGVSVRNGVLAPQELLSSVVSKGWPFGTGSKPSLPLESSSKPPKVAANFQVQNQGTGLVESKSGWLGDQNASAKGPLGRVGSERGAGKAAESDPQSDASVIVYSSGDDSYQSQVPSPQQLASLLGPGAEVLILDGRSGDELETEPGLRGGGNQKGGVKTASSSEDDLESDLGAMLGGRLYRRKQKRLENKGFSLESETGPLLAEGAALHWGGPELADVLPGLSSDVTRGGELSGDPGDLSFKHLLAQPEVADGSEPDAGMSSDAATSADAVRFPDGSQLPETGALGGSPLGHGTEFDAAKLSGAAQHSDVVRSLSESGAPDDGPLVHRTDSDAARGAAAGESVVGVRSPLFRLASDSTTGDASPRAPLDAVSGQLYGPLNLDDGYLDMVTDMEDVLLDTDGGSGLSRASSSFGHVAHPSSSRVPGGGFRRVEVVGVRYVATSPSERAQFPSERVNFASERTKLASGSPFSDGGRKGPQKNPGEVQLRQTRGGFGVSAEAVRTQELGTNAAALMQPLTNELTTFESNDGEGDHSPSRQAGFSGSANLEVEVYEDLLRGSDDEFEDSPHGKSPSDARTLRVETASDLRNFLGGVERNGTDEGERGLSGEGTTKPGGLSENRSAAGELEPTSGLKSPVGEGLFRDSSNEIGGFRFRVLVAEGSTAAAAAAAMAAGLKIGLPSAASGSPISGEKGRLDTPLNLSSEAQVKSLVSPLGTGADGGFKENAEEPKLPRRVSRHESSAEHSSRSEEDLNQHPLVEQSTRASESSVSTRSFSTDLRIEVDQNLPSKSTLAASPRKPLENTVDTKKPAQAPQQSGLVASLSHAAHAFSRPKPYTAYILQTVTRDGRVWTTERRYRDLAALRTELGRALPGAILPLPFAQVSAQKRNLFGSTDPDVVDQRKELFETCLNALIDSGPPLATAPPLIKFLCGSAYQTGSALTSKAKPASGVEEAGEVMSPRMTSGLTSPSSAGSPRSSKGEDAGGALGGGGLGAAETGPAVLGSSIRLIVDLPGKRSVSRQLQAQHNACAGCYKPFPPAPALLSWTNPAARLCEYSGQLYCADCHHKDTAILPAYVLQYWDFRPRKVSQIAKAYLDSIYDQPMLCVSAVNPHLYSRVPALARVKELRQRLVKMVTTTVRHCPAKRRLLAPAGSRRYLLEPGDFFALRDLVDLSKGAFAVLPEMMQTLTERVSAHIASGCDTCTELEIGGPR